MDAVCKSFASAIEKISHSRSVQKRLYRELEKLAVRVNVLVDPIKVTIEGEQCEESLLSEDIYLDRNVAIQIEEHDAVMLKGGFALGFLEHDVSNDIYVASVIESPDESILSLEKQKWFNAKSVELFIGENEVTNTIRDNSKDALLALDWQTFFMSPLSYSSDSSNNNDENSKQIVRMESLPSFLQEVGSCGYVVIDDVGVCILSHQVHGLIQGFLVVEEPLVSEDDDEEGDVAFAATTITKEETEVENTDIPSSAIQVMESNTTSLSDVDIAAPATPTPISTATIAQMTLAELEEFENTVSMSLFQRQQVRKRKEELEKHRRLNEFLHIQTPEAMGEVVTDDLGSVSTDSTPTVTNSTPKSATGRAKRGSIIDRFEEAKRQQQLQEEERLTKLKNDPRKKVTAQTDVKSIAGAYLSTEHEQHQPPTESPKLGGSGKNLGGARKSLRNMWEGVLETSKTTERDRFTTTKQNTIAQFAVTKGTGLVKKRIDEWEELFVQIAASAEEMEAFLRAAHELSQRKEFSKKLSGLNLTDVVSEFAESCLVPEDILLGDTRIYNVRLFTPVVQSYLKRMMQESKTNDCALPCGVYGEQSAKPPIDVFAVAIRTNDDKMYIAVTVKAAAGKEEDPDVYGIRKIVIFGKDTKTQVMEKLFCIVHEYSTPASSKTGALSTNSASTDNGDGAILSSRSNMASMTIDEADEDDDEDYGDRDDVQTGLLDDVHAILGTDESDQHQEVEEANEIYTPSKTEELPVEHSEEAQQEENMQPEGNLFAGEEYDILTTSTSMIPDDNVDDKERVETEEIETQLQPQEESQGESRRVTFEDSCQTEVELRNEDAASEEIAHNEVDVSIADEGDGTWTTAFTPMPEKSERDQITQEDQTDLADRLDVPEQDVSAGEQSVDIVKHESSSTVATTASSSSSVTKATKVTASPLTQQRRPIDDDDDDDSTSNDNDAEPDAAILDDESPTHFAKELCLAHVTIARTYLPSPIQRTDFSASKFNKTKFSWRIEDEAEDNLPQAEHFACNLNVRNVVTSTACSNIFVLDNLGHGADAYDRHCDLFTGTLRHATTPTHYSVTSRGDICFEWVRGAAASGWLLKWPMQSQRMGRRRWRFFVLRDNLLAYYASRPTSEEEIATSFSRNSLHLTETSNVAIGRKFLQRCLVVTTPLDTLWIRVRKDYQLEVNRWMREINQSITLQQRAKLIMSKTRVESRWYHESQNFFMVCVDARGYRANNGTQDPAAGSASSPLNNKSQPAEESVYNGSETRYLKAALFCLRNEATNPDGSPATTDTASASPASQAAANSRRGSAGRRSITETLLGTNKPGKPIPYNSNSIGSIDPATVQYSIDIASSDGTRQQLPVVDERESPILSSALTVLKLCGDIVLLGGAQGYLGVGRFTTLRLGTYTSNAEEAVGRLSHSPQPNGNKSRSAQIPVGTRRVLMVHPFHHPVHHTSCDYEYPHAPDSVITAMGMGDATSLVAVADSRGLVSLWEVPSHYPHHIRPRSSASTPSSATVTPMKSDQIPTVGGSSSSATPSRPGLLTKQKTKRQLRLEAIAAGEDINEEDYYDDDENDEGEDDDERYAMPLPSTAKTLHPRQRPRLLATVLVSGLFTHGYEAPKEADASKSTQERITKLIFAQHDHHLYVCTSQRLLLITVDHNHQTNRQLRHGFTQQRSLNASFRDWVVIDRALPDLEGIFDVVPPPSVSAQLFQEQMPVPPDVLEAMMDINEAGKNAENISGEQDSSTQATTPVHKKPALFTEESDEPTEKKKENEQDWKLVMWRALEYEGAPVDDAASSSSGILRSLGVTLGAASSNNAAVFAKRRCTVSRVAWSLDMFRAALRSLRPIRSSLTTTVVASTTL